MIEFLLDDRVRTLLKIALVALLFLWLAIRYYRVAKEDDAERSLKEWLERQAEEAHRQRRLELMQKRSRPPRPGTDEAA